MAQTQTQTNFFNVGDGASTGYGSDSYPATVIAVSKSGRKVTVQNDSYEWIKGTDQEYIYTRNENGSISEFSLRKNGRFYRVGTQPGHGGSLGHGRRYYQDPSF